MSMEKEWKELKVWAEGRTAVMAKMTELEKRSLPERVAELLENYSSEAFRAQADQKSQITGWYDEILANTISKVLRTGDTTELEAWQK